MYLRKSSALKYLMVVPLLAVFYCEWFIYIIQPLFWENLDCISNDSSCTKILFVADPQIQGDLGAPQPLNHLFIWDSDRYLRSTFTVAIKHFKPDVLVYLGDLTDEGSISSTVQFHSYVKRLFNIFDVYYPIVQIWLPGDNDIGGENEPIRKDKVSEFSAVFDQPSVIGYRNISFYRVNAITYSIPLRPDIEDLNYKMAVSHYPVISKGVFGRQVHSAIDPDIYFCAHEHTSKYVRQNKNFDRRETRLLQYDDPVLNVPTDDGWVYEVYVPTCSYRMGTSKMGFGAAVLENNSQRLRYTVFWSPQRFPYLIAYLIIIIIIFVYNFCYCAVRNLGRHQRLIIKDDILPLLQRM